MENQNYSQEDIDIFWTNFLKNNNMNEGTKCLEVFHFELTEKWANELLRLVLIGQKKATSSSLLSYEIEGDPIPQVGNFSVVTDWDGIPKCVIKTTNIRVIPFSDITYNICILEGEDDTLESWVDGHIRFFKKEGKQLGYEFSEDMPVVFEEFEVVYKV